MDTQAAQNTDPLYLRGVVETQPNPTPGDYLLNVWLALKDLREVAQRHAKPGDTLHRELQVQTFVDPNGVHKVQLSIALKRMEPTAG